MAFALLFGIVLAVTILCFSAIGVGLWLGRRRTLQGCACEFDPERARADGPACADCGSAPRKEELS